MMNVWLNSDELGVLEKFSGAKAKQESRYREELHSYDNWRYRSKEESKLHRAIQKDQVGDIILYRYMNLTELWQIIFDKCITVVSPRLWKDPLESPLLNAHVYNRNRKKRKGVLKNKFYAQCFSLDQYSEAMWKNYGTDHNMVRVSIKIKNLIEQLNFTEYLNNDVFLRVFRKMFAFVRKTAIQNFQKL